MAEGEVVPRNPIRGFSLVAVPRLKKQLSARQLSAARQRNFRSLVLLPLFSPLADNCHLITRSALAKTFGGIVRPICLAAFRLMTNSNFAGCSTGSSAGFAPLRIFST